MATLTSPAAAGVKRTSAEILRDQWAMAERRERKVRWTWARKRAARLAVTAA